MTLPSGTSAPFTCNQGYSPSNTNTLIQCIQTVTNSPTGTITPLPTCIPNYCSTLLSPSTNGLLNNQQQTINGTTGQVVQFSCSQGYTYTSVNTSSICQIDGTWSNQEGICTPSPCQSIQLPLSDGLIVSSINGNTGDIITYTCASYGYTLTGSSQQICLPTGVFANTVTGSTNPSCVRKSCGTYQSPFSSTSGVQQSATQWYIWFDDTIPCPNGYNLNGQQYVRCILDGNSGVQWQVLTGNQIPSCSSSFVTSGLNCTIHR